MGYHQLAESILNKKVSLDFPEIGEPCYTKEDVLSAMNEFYQTIFNPSIEELKFAEKVLDRVYQRLLETGIFRGEQRRVFHEDMNQITAMIKSTNESIHPKESV